MDVIIVPVVIIFEQIVVLIMVINNVELYEIIIDMQVDMRDIKDVVLGDYVNIDVSITELNLIDIIVTIAIETVNIKGGNIGI